MRPHTRLSDGTVYVEAVVAMGGRTRGGYRRRYLRGRFMSVRCRATLGAFQKVHSQAGTYRYRTQTQSFIIMNIYRQAEVQRHRTHRDCVDDGGICADGSRWCVAKRRFERSRTSITRSPTGRDIDTRFSRSTTTYVRRQLEVGRHHTHT